MNDINELHDESMNLVDQAYVARRQGDTALSETLVRQAYEKERAAAEQLKDSTSSEPTRSVLYRSAASLALECGDHRAAERLAATALAGDPPVELADELYSLLEGISFRRHLQARRIDLSPHELLMSIAGTAVGAGLALADVCLERVKDLDRLILRTVERKMGTEFRERGPATRQIQERYGVYMLAPRTGSFVVPLRVGLQMQLPGLDTASEVIDDILDCLELLNGRKENALRDRISDEAYYHNFVGLAKRIVPDGVKVSRVGLAHKGVGKDRQVELTRRQDEISSSPGLGKELVAGDGQDKQVKAEGRLLFADARRPDSQIKLLDKSGQAHTVVVPKGLMNDIVRPRWDENVVVTGILRKGKLHLVDIDRADG